MGLFSKTTNSHSQTKSLRLRGTLPSSSEEEKLFSKPSVSNSQTKSLRLKGTLPSSSEEELRGPADEKSVERNLIDSSSSKEPTKFEENKAEEEAEVEKTKKTC